MNATAYELVVHHIPTGVMCGLKQTERKLCDLMKINMLKNEWIKIINIRIGLVMLILLVALNLIAITSMDRQNSSSWRIHAEELYEEYAEAIGLCIKEGLDESYYEIFIEKIALLDYAFANNIPYGVTTIWNYVLNISETLGLFTIFVIYMGYMIYSKEYTSHTWKNLFCTGVKRNMIYWIKWVSVICCAGICFLVFLMISGIVGGFFLEIRGSNIVLNYENGYVVEKNIFLEIMVRYVLAFIKSIFYITLTHLCILFTEQEILSFFSAIIVMAGTPCITNLFEKYRVKTMLPFYYLNMDLCGDIRELVRCFIILFFYICVFTLISYNRFVRKEW